MYTLSSTLAAALEARTPQRVLLKFVTEDAAFSNASILNPDCAVFSNEDIVVSSGVDFDEIFTTGADPEIGVCPSAEIRFDMLNDEGQLVDFQFGIFRAYLGARIDEGTPPSGAVTATFTEDGENVLYEFMPLGVFMADRPYIVKKKILDIAANDLMTLFDRDMPTFATLGLSTATTLQGLYRSMCSYIAQQNNIPNEFLPLYNERTITNATFPVTETESLENMTMREVLGHIATLAAGIARFDRDGKLDIVWFGEAETTPSAYDEHDYSEFTPAWYETQAIDCLKVRNAESDTEATFGTGSHPYLIQGNPFITMDDTTS